MEKSLDEDSPVVILNAETGERVLHWVELDHSSDSEGSDDWYPRALIVYPALRLNDSTRYIVGIRNLYNTSGNLVTPSTAFLVCCM